MSSSENVIRIPPQKYIHVLDNNTNITRLEKGPSTFIRQEHETVVEGPVSMINLPPRHFCRISDPVIKDNKGEVYTDFGLGDNYKQVKNKFGEIEIRTTNETSSTFALYPGEKLIGKIEKLLVVNQNSALRFRAIRDFEDADKKKWISGEEWQRKGPFTYIPRIEEEVIGVINPEVIKPNTALKLKALRNLNDNKNLPRIIGEEWLIREQGAYLPEAYEKVVETIRGTVLTDKVCIHLRAIRNFRDHYKIQRHAGEEWLVTNKLASVHIQDIFEENLGIEDAITLSSRQFCVIINPYDLKLKLTQWGSKILKKGEATFFLNPGECLQNGIEKIIILGEGEALLLKAKQDFVDDEKQQRKAGQKWMTKGPREYIPPVEVEVVDRRKAIPLDANEGIYVRNIETGEVRKEIGKTYLLEANETLWEKLLPPEVEVLLYQSVAGISWKAEDSNNENLKKVANNWRKEKHKVVTFKAPHNTAVQLFDFKTNMPRVIFGPDLIMLEPDEQFTLITLSDGAPKVENAIKTLSLGLGPDSMSDKLVIETSDHARLSLQLAYKWFFKYDPKNEDHKMELFSVKDFIGDSCKSIASRVRGVVSGVTFEDFHHNSTQKIREAVFGKLPNGDVKEELNFKENRLCVTGVDIQNVEVTDEKTRELLSKSINLAITIATQSQEAEQKHKAERLDQENKGQLEILSLEDKCKAEESKTNLLVLQARSKTVEEVGRAIALAQAKTESELIASEAEVKQAELTVQAKKIEHDWDISKNKNEKRAELDYKKNIYAMEVKKAKEISEIEIKKFKETVESIGKETLISISRAGPEMKAKLLQGLGIKGYLVTDGKNPINLFGTANGLIGEMGNQKKEDSK